MAQIPEKANQNLLRKNIHQKVNAPSDLQSVDVKPIQAKKDLTILTKSCPKDKDPKQLFIPPKTSKSLANHQLSESSTQVASQKYKPSKVFAQKCLTELRALLETIKVDYQEEIKSLYLGEHSQRYTDLKIIIGEKFELSIHKCIVASRAYKFYSTLKLFRKPEEYHIIISNFQAHKTESEQPKDKTEGLSPEELIAKQLKEKQLKEALEPLECILPEGIFELDTLSNFIRRTYFNQDILDEDTQVNVQLINWIKVNKPELIQTNTRKTAKIQPDYRETFRTIQPDLELLSLTERTNSPATTELSITTDSALEATISKMNQHQESLDETSQTASLTRTETFDMILRSRNNSMTSSPAPTGVSSNRSATDTLTDDEDSRRQMANDSESSEVYVPTTRTGLKPKKFTTPIGMKSSPRTKPITVPTGDQSTPSNKLPERTGSIKKYSPAIRRSSGAGTSVVSTSPRSFVSAAKPTTSTPTSKSNKPTIITQAHPISLERSQSPAVITSKPKNFIAANKKLISQIEKKIASATGGGGARSSDPNDSILNQSIGNYDTENEMSDASFLAVEPLTSDNLASQLDKFTLVSYSKLAEALSKMFIGEILTDANVLVSGGNKQISAHKCILAARSAYLNDVINQQCLPLATSESITSKQLQPIKIDLGEFTYQAVYFSIMHIYSGIVKVPDDIDLDELSKLSHLLHVGTLRQVCIHNLRMNYCHYFHKPCQVCCIGVLKALPLAWRYDYTELYSKCLQWIGSHFAQIFCLEEFSNLKPHDLIEECYRATLCQLTPDSVIPKTIECQKLLKSLPRVKWTESIICMVGRQLEDFCHYVADNYEKILQTESFLALGKSYWECEVLEENLLAAMNHLKPDSGCKTLIQLDKIECSIEPMSGGLTTNEDGSSGKSVSESFASLIAKMRKYCERFLLKEAAAVVHCPSWKQMHPSLQKRIRDQALLSTDFDEPTKNLTTKPKLQSMSRQQGSRLSPSSPQLRSTSGLISPSPRSASDQASKLKSPNATYLPPPKNKPAAARHIKVLK